MVQIKAHSTFIHIPPNSHHFTLICSKTKNSTKMEACFLSHNSFTISTDQPIPTIRNASLSHPKRSSQPFQCRKVRTPFPISCKFLTLTSIFTHQSICLSNHKFNDYMYHDFCLKLYFFITTKSKSSSKFFISKLNTYLIDLSS